LPVLNQAAHAHTRRQRDLDQRRLARLDQRALGLVAIGEDGGIARRHGRREPLTVRVGRRAAQIAVTAARLAPEEDLQADACGRRAVRGPRDADAQGGRAVAGRRLYASCAACAERFGRRSGLQRHLLRRREGGQLAAGSLRRNHVSAIGAGGAGVPGEEQEQRHDDHERSQHQGREAPRTCSWLRQAHSSARTVRRLEW
jgi:hypothetical protein